MKASDFHKLTNSYHDVRLFNLRWAPGGKGPYIIRQLGYAPGDPAMDVKPFILQPDGTWLLSYHLACLPEHEQEKRLFHTMAEVVDVLDRIGSRKVRAIDTLPDGVSPEEALQCYKNTTARLIQHMHHANPEPPPNAGF